jgi:hypothetical protein
MKQKVFILFIVLASLMSSCIFPTSDELTVYNQSGSAIRVELIDASNDRVLPQYTLENVPNAQETVITLYDQGDFYVRVTDYLANAYISEVVEVKFVFNSYYHYTVYFDGTTVEFYR